MKKHDIDTFCRKKVGGKTGRMGIVLGVFFRILNRRDCPLDRSLVSDDLSPDEISATGGHRCFAL